MSRSRTSFTVAERVAWPVRIAPHRPRIGEPPARRLRIFALDPSASRLECAVAEVDVPYEPLGPGPTGSVLQVVDEAKVVASGRRSRTVVERYRPVDLESRDILLRGSLHPTPSDWMSHQQMVYAVAARLYAAFQSALGRDPIWGFAPPSRGPWRLELVPHAEETDNAWYDPETGRVELGYFRGKARPGGRNLPGGWVFLCLSHDIVAHELAHALLDGLRPQFNVASSADALGFHEGFSDIVAVLQRMTFEGVVRPAMRALRGDIGGPSVLSAFALQFGQSLGGSRPLRDAVQRRERDGRPVAYRPDMEAHDMGNVLLAAVFDAFEVAFRRRAALPIRLATAGTGILPAGDPPPELVDLLAREAAKLASHFLGMCVRAIDYCPPVDVTLGEFLRALVTADMDLVPEDQFAYREALIDAFRRRRIFPDDVASLDEDGLRWRPPRAGCVVVDGLRFGRLAFGDDPGRPASAAELRRQATVLGRAATRDEESLRTFGLQPQGASSDELRGLGVATCEVGEVTIESVRAARRTRPDGSIAFELVAELIQPVELGLAGGRRLSLRGGSTVIIGPGGELRLVIAKRATRPQHIQRQLAYILGRGLGEKQWVRRGRRLVPAEGFFRRVCGGHGPGASRGAG